VKGECEVGVQGSSGPDVCMGSSKERVIVVVESV
jgi:hypothetical protein